MTRRKKKKLLIKALISGALIFGSIGYSHYEENRVEGISISQRINELDYLHEKIQSTYMTNANHDQAYHVAKEEIKKSKKPGTYTNILYKYVTSTCDPYSMPFTDYELVNYYFHFSKQTDSEAFLKMLTNEKTLAWYGWTLEEIDKLDLYFPPVFSTNVKGESFKFTVLENGKVGYLKVYNMNYKTGKEEEMVEELKQIYGELEGLEKLIIDIRDTNAFDDVFWKKEMVAPLVYGNLTIEETYLLKSEKNKAYYENLGFDFEKVTPEQLKDIQSPYKDMATLISKKKISIDGTRNEPLETQVYLLVNRLTKGEAGKLAHFAKSSGFATVVGTETSKKYNFYLPSIFSLKDSGMIVGIYDLVFLTPEGNHSFFNGVKPDIEIENNESRVDALDVGILSIIEMKK